MGEHVGEGNYPTYVEVLRRAVRPGGRVLVQQMSAHRPRIPAAEPFIECFIAPDMHMRPVGETVAHLESGGLEVRDVHATARALRADGAGLARRVRGHTCPT